MTATNRVIPIKSRFCPTRFRDLENKASVWVLVGPDAWSQAEQINAARQTSDSHILAAVSSDPLTCLDGGLWPLVVTPKDMAAPDWRHRLVLAGPGTLCVNIERAGAVAPGLLLELAAHIASQAHPAAELRIDGNRPDMDVIALHQQNSQEGPAGMPSAFRLTGDGVWFDEVSPKGDLEPVRLCAPLAVLAVTHDPNEGAYGRLLEWHTLRGTVRRWAMPMELLSGNGEDLRRALLAGGLDYISPNRKARERLLEYLAGSRPGQTLTSIERTGWHDGHYVLPDATLGPNGQEIIFQSGNAKGDDFTAAGSLGDWQEQIGRLCLGNSRLLFAVSCAFAAPLLRLAGMDGGGFHLKGESTDGKTTVMKAAASVCGGGDYWHTWRATGNAIEAIASRRNDALLCLDELKEIDPKAAGSTAYMLANGQGKGRSRVDGELRDRKQWRLLFFSTGELSLAEHAEQAGGRFFGGMDVRLPQISSDTGKHGCFETLHGFPSAKTLADALRLRTSQTYGAPFRAFLERLADELEQHQRTIRAEVIRFTQELIPGGAGNQVGRVAERFALVAAAGELATRLGVTGWAQGDALAGVRACFAAWLAERGHLGNYEDAAALEQVRRFFTANQYTRFADWHDNQHRPANLVGYRRAEPEGIAFYVTAIGWSEITKGYDAKKVARLCQVAGYLEAKQGDETRRQQLIRLPGMTTPVRVYKFTERVIGGDEWEDDAD